MKYGELYDFISCVHPNQRTADFHFTKIFCKDNNIDFDKLLVYLRDYGANNDYDVINTVYLHIPGNIEIGKEPASPPSTYIVFPSGQPAQTKWKDKEQAIKGLRHLYFGWIWGDYNYIGKTGRDNATNAIAQFIIDDLDENDLSTVIAPDGTKYNIQVAVTLVKSTENNDESDGEGEVAAGNYISPMECIKNGTHLKSCDRDGYCNYCGHQDSPEEIRSESTGQNRPQ